MVGVPIRYKAVSHIDTGENVQALRTLTVRYNRFHLDNAFTVSAYDILQTQGNRAIVAQYDGGESAQWACAVIYNVARDIERPYRAVVYVNYVLIDPTVGDNVFTYTHTAVKKCVEYISRTLKLSVVDMIVDLTTQSNPIFIRRISSAFRSASFIPSSDGYSLSKRVKDERRAPHAPLTAPQVQSQSGKIVSARDLENIALPYVSHASSKVSPDTQEIYEDITHTYTIAQTQADSVRFVNPFAPQATPEKPLNNNGEVQEENTSSISNNSVPVLTLPQADKKPHSDGDIPQFIAPFAIPPLPKVIPPLPQPPQVQRNSDHINVYFGRVAYGSTEYRKILAFCKEHKEWVMPSLNKRTSYSQMVFTSPHGSVEDYVNSLIKDSYFIFRISLPSRKIEGMLAFVAGYSLPIMARDDMRVYVDSSRIVFVPLVLAERNSLSTQYTSQGIETVVSLWQELLYVLQSGHNKGNFSAIGSLEYSNDVSMRLLESVGFTSSATYSNAPCFSADTHIMSRLL